MPSPASLLAARIALFAAALAVPLALAAPTPALAAERARTTGPVVVELFTSQGCSSCPPADALLDELAGRDDIIALSLHVDYWDYIGWKDPYASPQMTERQRAYAQALALRYVYTPQIVIDGRADVVGSRRGEVMAEIEAAAGRGKPVEIAFELREGGRVIVPQGHAPDRGATIWLAVYDEGHETQVRRGENAGRTLRNAHVVRRLERLGTWMGERLEIPLNLDAAAAQGSYGCAVILQQGRNGPVLGAGTMRLDSLAK